MVRRDDPHREKSSIEITTIDMGELGCVALSGMGAEGRDRTADTTIFSRMLYQLSYLGPELPWGVTPRRWAIEGSNL
jgi:hypothetical protein